MKVFFVCFAWSVAVFQITAAIQCTCPTAVHPQADFCHPHTDYVIRAKVLSEKEMNDAGEQHAGLIYHTMKYRVKIASVYKGNLTLDEGEKANIFIPPNYCGFHLEKGRFYLISGTGTKHHSLKSNVCHWITRMSDLTFHQRLSLTKKRYKKSCFDNCDLTKSGCAKEPGVPDECYDKYATCYRRPEYKPNVCTWRHGGGFYYCKNGAK